MLEMDGSSKQPPPPPPPPISEMLSKFALAFKAKTFEFFAEEEEDDQPDQPDLDDDDVTTLSLLDSAEDFIPDQKVVVIKPDGAPPTPPELSGGTHFAKTELSDQTRPPPVIRPINIPMTQNLISSLFATLASFEDSYLQLQTAQVPFVEENVTSADRALVSHLQRLSELKQLCFSEVDSGSGFGGVGSCLEAQVQENQSKLRSLGTVSNRLQSDIDRKDNEVEALRKKLGEIQSSNFRLSQRLCSGLNSKSSCSSSCEVLLSVRVFDSVRHDACRLTHRFAKLLISLMGKAGWDLDLAANLVHPDVCYAKIGHNRYAFLSYVCLGMFKGFDSKGFGLVGDEVSCNGRESELDESSVCLKQLLEHVSSNPMELLTRDKNCEFSRFCESKYQEIIHPTMESSMFSNFDRNAVVLSKWRSLSVFYESFVNMASSIWTLHKLAYCFDPVVEIFQVERDAEFSMIYMEDVTRRLSFPAKTREKVGFTVVPGFKIGRTIIQSQVYLSGLKCTE